MNSAIWTDELLDRVRELWPTHSATQIADALRKDGHFFTRNAIVGKLHRAKLNSSHKTEEHKMARNNSERKPRIAARQGEHHVVRKIVRAGYEGGYRIHTTTEYTAPALHCVEAESRNLTLQELEPNDCRFIAGNDMLFCGHPKKPGSSFCHHHHARCFVAAKPATPKARMWQPDFSRGAA